MSRLDGVVARVAAVVGLLHTTLRVLALVGALGVLALVGAVARVGGWDGDTVVLATVLAGLTGLVPVILARYAADLGPVRSLPEVSAAELKEAAGTLKADLKAGERSFVDHTGLRRVLGIGRALWDLRSDLEAMRDGGLAPAAALTEVVIPTRLIRVGISAVLAPCLLAVGLSALVLALTLS